MHDETSSVKTENIAQTLARELPKPQQLLSQKIADLASTDSIAQLALPSGFKLEAIDLEKLLPNPRRTSAVGTLSDCDSFLAYIKRFQQDRTVVWCDFNPQSYLLSFTCVIDEHAANAAGWRAHKAVFTPAMSAEWGTWTSNNKQPKEQVEFAEYIERHEPDIAAQEGYPTSLQMLQMATEFEANSEKRFKSVVRLQGGGVRMDYVDDEDANTLAQMKVFEKFQIGIPVFWASEGYRIDARLKYRQAQGKLKFWYELIRPDRVHEAAAKDLIERVRAGIGELPLLMGNCK